MEAWCLVECEGAFEERPRDAGVASWLPHCEEESSPESEQASPPSSSSPVFVFCSTLDPVSFAGIAAGVGDSELIPTMHQGFGPPVPSSAGAGAVSNRIDQTL